MNDHHNKSAVQDGADQQYDPLWEEVENDDRKLPRISAGLDQLVTGVGTVVMWVNVMPSAPAFPNSTNFSGISML
jgi:hypothetical protein